MKLTLLPGVRGRSDLTGSLATTVSRRLSWPLMDVTDAGALLLCIFTLLKWHGRRIFVITAWLASLLARTRLDLEQVVAGFRSLNVLIRYEQR